MIQDDHLPRISPKWSPGTGTCLRMGSRAQTQDVLQRQRRSQQFCCVLSPSARTVTQCCPSSARHAQIWGSMRHHHPLILLTFSHCFG